ncbi:TonB-dependent receptor domain-containing protein [Brevundimonas sp.]|uniref:TonB-dependent receptor domain-containing protein n=1 Tax=Brevundimonas sp. TaxID=1871086 RepID=UPI003D0D6EAB
MNTNRYRRGLLATTIIGGAALAMAATPSFAQSTDDQATEVGEIVVTGSRIARQDYRSTSPIVTVDAQDFQATGAVTIDSLINDLPQFTPSISSTSNNPSNGGQANINLRNLGSNRTLVLLNGRRVVPSNSDGSVDVNLIPTALIKNIEIISGGASAAYGSDALAGVANFIIDENFSGVQADVQYGETDRKDGVTQSYSLTVGGNFDDDRGNMVLSLSRSTRETIFNAARPFSAVSGPSGTSPLGSTTFDSTNRPSDAFVKAYFNNQTIDNTGAFGFNDDNSIFAYIGKLNVKNPAGAGPEYTQPGANYTFNTGPLNYLQLPLERYNAYAAGRYKINDNAEVYVNALFTQYTADTELAASPASGNPAAQTGFRVPATNPFITGDLRNFLNARPNPTSSFLLNKRFTSLGGRHSEDEYNIYQLTSGVRGRVPQSEWTYDAYVSYGRVSNTTTQTGNVSRSSVQRLLDAPDGGASLCAGGFDPFGVTNLSADCLTYIGRSARNSTVTEQTVIEASMQGKAFDLPAGEVRVAFGAQYRQDDFAFGADASLAQTNASVARPDGGFNGGSEIAGFNPTPSLSGGTSSKEVFIEALVPLLADLPFIEQLDLNLGYRYADYSTAGGTQAYRADLDWSIIGGLRARGGYSRSVRAPSIGELFSTASTGFPSIGEPSATGTEGDPCDRRSSFRAGANAAQVQALCLAQGLDATAYPTYVFSNNQVQGFSGGNPGLNEETSDSWTGGFVYQPTFSSPWLSRVSASIDYYNIEITDAIGAIAASDAIQGCFNSTGENPTFDAGNSYCQLFTRDPLTGNITGAIENNANLGAVKTSGIDFQGDWSFDLGEVGAPDWGRLSFNTVISWLENYEDNVVEGGAFTDRTGTISSTFGNTFPEWKALSSVSWANGPFSVGARWRRVGEITVINSTTVLPSIDYFDMNASWSVNDTVSLRAGVNNLSDEQPNVYVPGVQANTDPSTYDVLGRRYYVGLTAKF